MQKNEVVHNDESGISDKRKEKLKKLFEYEEKRENGKIVLLNNKIRLVQLTDCKEDREIYKTVITDYKDFLHNFRKLDTDIDREDFYDFESLHDDCENFPLFACYNKQNKLIGTCGSRHRITVKHGQKEFSLQEISERMMQKYIKHGYGAIAFAMIVNYFSKKKQNFFFTSFSDSRDYYRKLRDIVAEFCFIGSKQRIMNENFFGYVGAQDFYCSLNFDGLLDQLR
ncbi:MAG: hypothetical protein IJT14_02175 [Rickettsiales bacterium]|nr:hypothetical protein [Rickettsiales bacterium]